MSSDWLLKIGIGGVQRLISEARKTHDLRIGSEFVSTLARGIGHSASEHEHVSLVRPASTKVDHWPHQLVLRLTQQNSDDVRTLGNTLKQDVRESVQGFVGDDVRELLTKNIREQMRSFSDEDLKTEIGRLANLLEVYWVAVPIETSLAEASANLFRLYDDRRHTRTFLSGDAATDDQPWVCSLCGDRRAVIKPKGGRTWKSESRLLKRREKLCLFCLAKRTQSAEAIASTHAIAKDRFFRMTGFADVRDSQTDRSIWMRVFDQWDALMPPVDRSAGFKPAEEDAFHSLSDSQRRDVENLSPYYGIILYDGDQMGEWFSGQRFEERWLKQDDEYQQAQMNLSNALLEFAKAVNGHAKVLNSEVVYAGGDEGLILTPIDFVLPWMDFLNANWAKVHSESTKYKNPQALPMTLSAHVSLVHAKAPLQPVLRSVHQSLEAAKQKANRNCVSVKACPGSGAASETILRWDELEQFNSALALFCDYRVGDDSQAEPFAKELLERKGSIAPNRLVYKALRSLDGFFDPSTGDIALAQQLRLELKRIADVDQAQWQQDWSAVVDWLVDRGKVIPRRPGLNGHAAVGEILQVIAWMSRQLQWGRA